MSLTVFNNKLYFRAKTSNKGTELYEYDGTNSPTFYDLKVGSSSSNPVSTCAALETCEPICAIA